MNLKRKHKCADLIIAYIAVSSKQWISKTPPKDIFRIKSIPFKTNEKIKSQ